MKHEDRQDHDSTCVCFLMSSPSGRAKESDTLMTDNSTTSSHLMQWFVMFY